LEILVCPLTRATLSYDAERQELISRAAKLAYPIRDGIPIMLPDEARGWRTEMNPQLFAAYLLITFVLVIAPGRSSPSSSPPGRRAAFVRRWRRSSARRSATRCC